MKKLLLASIVMIGFGSMASAQTLRPAKKQAAAPATAQPTPKLMASPETAMTAPATAPVRVKTDADAAKEAEAKKVEATKKAKAVAPAKKTN